MSDTQPGILEPVPPLARYLTFNLMNADAARDGLAGLVRIVDGRKAVVGLGPSLAGALGARIPGLRSFPPQAGPGIDVPATPTALWCWLRGADRGELVHETRAVRRALGEGFELDQAVDAFRYGPSLDQTGYEDGTENPEGPEAVAAAVVAGAGAGMDGSSFVAVQQWVHDLDRFASMAPQEQDHVIGRRKRDNEELDDAPPSAHVKRTAQEDFDPPAFILRRSMPWADAARAGLIFVAFGKSFTAFEALLKRMVGAEDGVTDALFRFTRPVTGSFFWCPPMAAQALDLRALGA